MHRTLPARSGAEHPPDGSMPAVAVPALDQASAQPDPMRVPDTNTSVAGEEDRGAALDMATADAADAANRRAARLLAHRPCAPPA